MCITSASSQPLMNLPCRDTKTLHDTNSEAPKHAIGGSPGAQNIDGPCKPSNPSNSSLSQILVTPQIQK
eukprot:c30470_g1_i1 orf=89-295(-)